MVDSPGLTTFLLAAASLMLTPGPAKLFLAGMSAAHGFGIGAKIALGILVSDLVHITLVVIGVALIINSNDTARAALAILGGVFLAHMSYGFLRKAIAATSQRPTLADVQERSASPFVAGLLLNLFNPLALAFYLSFLPQFTTGTSVHLQNLQTAIFGYSLVAVFFLAHLGISRVASLAGGREMPAAYVRATYGAAAAILAFMCLKVLLGVLSA